MTLKPSKTTEPTPPEHFHGVRQGVKLRGKQISDKPVLFQYEVVEMMPVSEHQELMLKLQRLRILVHAHTQTIRGMCTDELDQALVRLDNVVNTPEEET